MLDDSPLIQELMGQAKREVLRAAVTRILTARFSAIPPETAALLRAVQDEEQLQRLNQPAALCPDLESFRARLPS
jgi:hypothetical protein